METPIASPRYALIAQRLAQDIQQGAYPVGTLLPREHDLAATFGVARNTARQAIGVLIEMGLVATKRGVGTVVRGTAASPKYVHSTDSIDSLVTYAHETELRVVGSRRITAQGSEQLELLRGSPGQSWLEVVSGRFQRKDGLPVAYTLLYVPIVFAGIVDYMEGSVDPTYTLLEKHFGQRVLEVEQTAIVTVVSKPASKVLAVKPGSPAQLIVRHYLGAHQAVLIASRTVYPMGRFTLSTKLRLVSSTPS